MKIVADQGLSVVLSSHLLADLERVCDYVVVLVASRVVAGDVSAFGSHALSRRARSAQAPRDRKFITKADTDNLSNRLIRTNKPILDP